MPQKIRLTVPVEDYEVSSLNLRFLDGLIEIEMTNTNGDRLIHLIQNPQATVLMRALNKADLSTNSLQKRIMERLVTDGVLTGTISGTPD